MIETKYGVYGESNLDHLTEVFEKYLPGKFFVDLGAGKGLVVDKARKYTSMVKDIEIEKQFKHGQEDLFNAHFDDFEVFYYYLLGTDDELRLIKKIETECKKGAIIIFYHWKISKENQDKFYSKIKYLEFVESYDKILVYKHL